MKNLKYVLIMFVALTATIACSDDGDSDGGDVNPIVGTWGVSGAESGFEVSLSATFAENNKGTMVVTIGIGGESQTENSSFTWSTSGDQLTMVMDGETEVSTYSVSGNELTITDDDGSITVLTRE